MKKTKKGKKMATRSRGTNHTLRVEVMTPNQQTAIVPAQEQQAIPPDNVQMALDRAEKQMYYRTQLLKLIAKQIDPRDIYLYVLAQTCLKCGRSVKPAFTGDGFYCSNCKQIPKGGAEENLGPYLSGNGCRFVLSSAGAKFEDPTIVEKTYQGTEGPYIDFEVWVTVVTADGRCVRTMGNNSTNDDFFAKRSRWICEQCNALTQYGGKDGAICPVHGKCKAKREGYYLSMQEVDIPAVKQKAMTNAWNHAVRDLGFMPTIQHLKDAGVDLGKLKRISFAKTGDEGEEFAVTASNAAPQSAPAGERESVDPPKSKWTGPVSKSPAGVSVGKVPPWADPNRPATLPAPARTDDKPKSVESTPKKEIVRPTGPPKASIPSEDWPIGSGFVDDVARKTGSKGLYLRIVQAGKTLYCFDNRQVSEEGERLFDLIEKAKGQLCQFVTIQKAKGDKVFIEATMAVKLGDREWLEDGTPVLRRDPPQKREPGDDTENDGGFAASDDDLPPSLFPGNQSFTREFKP